MNRDAHLHKALNPHARVVRGGASKFRRLGFGHVTARAHVDATRAEAERREIEREAERRAFLEKLAQQLATYRLPLETCRRHVSAVAVSAAPAPAVELPASLRRFG